MYKSKINVMMFAMTRIFFKKAKTFFLSNFCLFFNQLRLKFFKRLADPTYQKHNVLIIV